MQGGRTSDRAVLRRRLRRAAILAMFMLGCWAAVSGAAVQVHADRWRWSNPLPHGNNVLDMLVTADLSVQVGDGGSIHVRGTDARWAPVDSGVTNYLRGTALFGNRILAVGEHGCIIWSDNDGVFQPAVLNPVTSDWFEGVDVSGRQAMAVGDNGAVYTSTNGMDWIRVSSGTAEWLRSVACGPGASVAVGENGTVLKSINGTSWNLVDSGTAEHLNRVRYLGTGASARFVAVGNHGTMITSSTGDAPWTIQPTGTTNDLYDAAWNEDGLLLAGDQELRFQAAGTSGWVDQIEGISSNAAPAWIYLSAAAASNNWS